MNILSSLHFPNGSLMKNRFMLAPMTNKQSFEDGSLSEDELHWLTMRAKGQFGMVMTCASHVQLVGKGFERQLGIYDDFLIEGHKRLVSNIQSYGSLAVIQLHHAGMRSPFDVIGEKAVCPSTLEKYNARALSLEEVIQLRDDFIAAAVRAQQCGYDGVEVHGAHGYIITQFLSKKINERTDEYGGSLENRCRILYEIVEGIREACSPSFLLGVRLSPERFGMELEEMQIICQQLIDSGNIDFLDISLWDSFKYPEEEAFQDKPLLDYFTTLDRKEVKLTVAGNIRTAEDVIKILNSNVDFVSIGRAGILHHDFPQKVIENPQFVPIATPVSKAHLQNEGLGKDFIEYMQRWQGFVLEED